MSLPSAQEKQAQAEESFVSKINTMIQKAEPEIGCVCKEIPAVFPFNKHPSENKKLGSIGEAFKAKGYNVSFSHYTYYSSLDDDEEIPIHKFCVSWAMK